MGRGSRMSTATTRPPTPGRRWRRSRSPARLPAERYWNGKIYVAEGDTGNSFRIYDIATNTWTLGAPRPVGQWLRLCRRCAEQQGVRDRRRCRSADAADHLRHRDQHLVDGQPGTRRRLPLRLPDGRQLPVHRRWLRGELRRQLDRDHAPGHVDRHLVAAVPPFTPQRADFAPRLVRDEAVCDRRRPDRRQLTSTRPTSSTSSTRPAGRAEAGLPHRRTCRRLSARRTRPASTRPAVPAARSGRPAGSTGTRSSS